MKATVVKGDWMVNEGAATVGGSHAGGVLGAIGGAARSWRPSAPHVLTRGSVWWGHLVDDERFVGLVREIEMAKGGLSTHEARCDERYKQIAANTSVMKDDIASIKTTVDRLGEQGRHAAWSANWKAWAIAASMVGVVGSIMLAYAVWTTAQLYQLEPLRVHAAAKK